MVLVYLDPIYQNSRSPHGSYSVRKAERFGFPRMNWILKTRSRLSRCCRIFPLFHQSVVCSSQMRKLR